MPRVIVVLLCLLLLVPGGCQPDPGSDPHTSTASTPSKQDGTTGATPAHSEASGPATTAPPTPKVSDAEPSQPRFQATFLELFDTLTQIVGYADDEATFRQEVEAIKEDLRVYHELYDIYHTYNGVTNLKTLNDHAGQGPMKVDAKIIDLLDYAREMYTLTHGTVNIAMGSVLRVWHDYREAGLADPAQAKLPELDTLKAANAHTAIDDLVIDREAMTVELKDPEMRLDVGAIAKGYATEQVARQAEERGVKYMLLSVGGNVRAIGGRGLDEVPWRVSIRNPFEDEVDERPHITILHLQDASLVTSGVYERYYVVDGKRYHHIIDPETLFPEMRFMSVSVVTKDSGLADALSTAIFNMDLEEGQAFIESLDDTEALWIMPDGTEYESSGFRALEYHADA